MGWARHDAPAPAACSARANGAAALRLLAALMGLGLRHLVLCPGSRSAPLAVAAALLEPRGLVLHTAIDERSAAFFALGLGRGRGVAAAVATTSGTAVAQLLPACVEADLGTIPLLLLSADRPVRLKGCGANQAVAQERFLAASCRLLLQGAPTGIAACSGAELVDLAATAMAAAHGDGRWQPAGPVHLNLPFEEPIHAGAADLEALRQLAAELPLAQPRPSALGAPATAADGREGRAAVPRLDPDRAGVVVAGPWRGSRRQWSGFCRALRWWQARSGWPLLADPLSGLRGLQGLVLIGAYDLLLEHPATAPAAPQVLRLGSLPASRRLEHWLQACGGDQVLVSEGDPRRLDPLGTVPRERQWSGGLAAWLTAQGLGPAAADRAAGEPRPDRSGRPAGDPGDPEDRGRDSPSRYPAVPAAASIDPTAIAADGRRIGAAPAGGNATPGPAALALAARWERAEARAQERLDHQLADHQLTGRGRDDDDQGRDGHAHDDRGRTGRGGTAQQCPAQPPAAGAPPMGSAPPTGTAVPNIPAPPAACGGAASLVGASLVPPPTASTSPPPPGEARGGDPGTISEPWLARSLSRLLPPGLPLMLANSSPVRDWANFADPHSPWRPIHGFRGASGIDGTLSIACGLAEALGQLLLVSGDLALLHDANGWLWSRQLRGRLTVVLIENGGGGIFEQLPIRPQPPALLDFDRLFAMPQPLDQLALAALHGVPGRRLQGRSDLPAALAWALQQRFCLLEVRSQRRADADLRRRLRLAISRENGAPEPHFP
ncbi:MAG: 2-succinyl-5-enolpyruvyl-6-hydroxy-3-cyclohexene-1-carboxylic-acid synthase [Synechococcus sp.]|nr:2-succinyl-5-enolpyruvyl-6-hydroxy-3-cyclohexene-1-carboxylic-acid synthase [Synechococcus sp.]